MNRITITFGDAIFKKLEDRMKEKGISSIAQCVRELLDLALRIEEAAKNSEADKEKPSEELQAILEVKELLKTNMLWSMETRLLSKALISNTKNLDKTKPNEIFEKCKESATAHVKGFLKEAL